MSEIFWKSYPKNDKIRRRLMVGYPKRGEDMIEIIYNDEKGEDSRKNSYFQLPKNIRQIGDIDKGKKIYIEDYVVTYLNQYSSVNITQTCAAVLLGRVNLLEGTQYIFISGALSVKGGDFDTQRMELTEQTWNTIYEEKERYFKNHEIVGWFLSAPGQGLVITEAMERCHTKNFAGNDKVLFLRETMEREEGFFAYEGSGLVKQEGYYIYYEKNTAMQDYMVVQNEGKLVDEPEAISDKAIINFRRILAEKKEGVGRPKVMGFMYGASTFLIVTVLVIGITMINNYEKMKTMEETLANISNSVGTNAQSLEVVNQKNVKKEADKTKVENILGEVVPQERKEEVEAETKVNPGSPPRESGQAVSSSNVNQYYTVVEGDTMASISQKFYGNLEKVEEIRISNNLENSEMIYPGQKIFLP